MVSSSVACKFRVCVLGVLLWCDCFVFRTDAAPLCLLIHTRTHAHTHTLSLTHTHTHTHSLSLFLPLLPCDCLFFRLVQGHGWPAELQLWV